ncbi:MAG: hypothetical protein ACM3ZC_12780 [Bacteroidota bacterium]
MHQVCLSSSPSIMAYAAPEGLWELRAALSDYLSRVRGLACRAEEFVIVSGATQGLSLVSRLLLTRNAHAVVEDCGS